MRRSVLPILVISGGIAELGPKRGSYTALYVDGIPSTSPEAVEQAAPGTKNEHGCRCPSLQAAHEACENCLGAPTMSG